jgi:hypothetical protein
MAGAGFAPLPIYCYDWVRRILESPSQNDRITPFPNLLVLDDRVGSRSDRLSTKVESVGFAHRGASPLSKGDRNPKS